MKNRLGLISWATGTLMLAAVSACGGSDADPPATAEPVVDVAELTDDERLADLAVRRGERRCHRGGTDLLHGRSTSSGSDPCDRPQEAEVRRDERAAQRRRDPHRPTAATRASARPAPHAINELKVQSVNLDNSDPDAGKVPTVVIDVCWDVSKVDVLDKSGKSIVSPNRPDTGWTRYTVANYDYAADPTGGWRVATGQDLKKTPCAAS